MGKPTGFMEYDREVSKAVEPKERIKNFDEFHIHLSKKKQEIPLPERGTAEYLSVAYSHPLWLVRMWIAYYGRLPSFSIRSAIVKLFPPGAAHMSKIFSPFFGSNTRTAS